MARPKKKMVEVAETVETSLLMEEDTGDTGGGQEAPAASSSPPATDASPGKVQREKAVAMFKVLKARADGAESFLTDARAKLKLAERLHAAKKKRWEAPKNHRGERKLRKPFRVASRIYEAVIELDEARLQCAWAERAAAEGARMVALSLCRMERMECVCLLCLVSAHSAYHSGM